MKRYRLPDALGGGEAELIERAATGYPSFSSLQIDGVVVIVPQEYLTEVTPPEPPIGTFVACGADGNLLPFYRRWDEGWFELGNNDSVTWQTICDDAQARAGRWPILLGPVPEPVEPTRLPYEFRIDEHSDATGSAAPLFVKVDPDCSRRVRFGFYSTISRSVSPAQAREIGRAFLTAAAEVEL